MQTEVKDGPRSALDVVATATCLAELPAALGSRLALELGLKPVLREMHDVEGADAARTRWEAAGLEVLMGPIVSEHIATAAAAIDAATTHYTVRPLRTHPLVERAVATGGPVARRLLLGQGRVNTWLKERLGADQYPERMTEGGDSDERAHGVRRRRVLYVGREPGLLQQARSADAMGEGTEDALTLGALLGYPPCCVAAFAALPVRYPNRIPIAASMRRTRRYEPLLNNVCLERFAYIVHFPCSYDCGASLAIATELEAAMSAVNPALMATVLKAMGTPRLYVSDTHQAVLKGASQARGRVSYRQLVRLDEHWPLRSDAKASARSPYPWTQLTPLGGGTLKLGTAVAAADQDRETPLLLPFGLH